MEKRQAFRSLVTFRLGQQAYALPIESIVQIVEIVTIVPIPRINHSVEGVINYHGKAIPAVNLRRHLGLPVVPFGLDTHIMVAESAGRTIGLLVDQVLSVSELPDAEISNPGDILPDGLGEVPFLSGVTHVTGEMVFVLDLEHLFVGQPAEQLAQAIDVFADTFESAEPELEAQV